MSCTSLHRLSETLSAWWRFCLLWPFKVYTLLIGCCLKLSFNISSKRTDLTNRFAARRL